MFTINIIFSQYKVSWSFKQSFEITTNAFEEIIVPTHHYNAPSMVLQTSLVPIQVLASYLVLPRYI